MRITQVYSPSSESLVDVSKGMQLCSDKILQILTGDASCHRLMCIISVVLCYSSLYQVSLCFLYI